MISYLIFTFLSFFLYTDRVYANSIEKQDSECYCERTFNKQFEEILEHAKYLKYAVAQIKTREERIIELVGDPKYAEITPQCKTEFITKNIKKLKFKVNFNYVPINLGKFQFIREYEFTQVLVSYQNWTRRYHMDKCPLKSTGEPDFNCKYNQPLSQEALQNFIRDVRGGTLSAFEFVDKDGIKENLKLTVAQQKMFLKLYEIYSNNNHHELLIWVKNDGSDPKEFVKSIMPLYSQLDNLYNDERRDGDWFAKGQVTASRQFTAMRGNIANDFSGSPSVKAGICRDAASFIAQLLEAKGFKAAYVGSHSTLNAWHVDVTAQDPVDKNLIYHLDYGRLCMREDVDGSMAVRHGPMAFGIGTRIFSPFDKHLAYIPSTEADILQRSVNGSVSELYPLSADTGNYLDASFLLHRSSSTHGKVFAGTAITGQKYFGFGAYGNYLSNTQWSGELGASLFVRHQPGELFLGDDCALADLEVPPDITSFGMYLRGVQNIPTTSFKVGKYTDVNLKANLSVYAMGAISTAESFDSPKVSGDIAGGLNPSVEVQYSKDKYSALAEFKASISPSLANVSDMSSFIPALNFLLFRLTQNVQLSEMIIFTDATIVYNQIGTNARAQLGIATEKVAVNISAGQNLGDGARINPGSIGHAKLGAQYNITDEIGIHGSVGVTHPGSNWQIYDANIGLVITSDGPVKKVPPTKKKPNKGTPKK